MKGVAYTFCMNVFVNKRLKPHRETLSLKEETLKTPALWRDLEQLRPN